MIEFLEKSWSSSSLFMTICVLLSVSSHMSVVSSAIPFFSYGLYYICVYFSFLYICIFHIFQEQYKFCHQAVISYLQTFDTYSNFKLTTHYDKRGPGEGPLADVVYATVKK